MQESKKPLSDRSFWEASIEDDASDLAHLGEDQELELQRQKARFRHRIVGAVVLVAALATVLPIFFEEPAIQSDRHAQTQIPAISKEPFYKMELPVNERPKMPMPADPSALKDLSQPNIVKDAPEARPLPELDGVGDKTQTYVPTSDGSLYIQVLATSSEAGAMREMARYQAMGLPVYSVKVQKKAATLWRVRLGLFKTKEEADRVVKLLDARKISHLPVQIEESAKRDMNRIAPARTLKNTVQEARTRAQDAAAKKAEPVKAAAPKKTEVKKAASASTKSAGTTGKQVEKKTSSQAKAKDADQKTQKKPASADPLADLLKSARQEDVIAQKLREARQ